MATTSICASSAISLYSTPAKPTTRTLHTLSHSPSSFSQRLDLNIVFNDESLKAVALANAAVQAAKDAANFALVLSEMSFNEEKESEAALRSGARRRKRRKRRKGFSNLEAGRDERMEVQRSFKSCSRSAVLTSKQEAQFTLYIKEGAKVEAAWSESTSSQWAETMGMKRSSLERTMFKARESRERIVLSYRRLVVSIANSYQYRGLSLQDLIQEGSIGLLQGAERFDPKKGNKLSTYVYWWIKQAIIRAIASKSRLTRLPGSMSEMIPKIAEANAVLSRRLRRQPTLEEIATMTSVPFETVKLLSDGRRLPMSLDQTLTKDGGTRLQDILEGPVELEPETMLREQLMKQEVEKLLKKIDEREAIILRLYFGLTGERPHSFEEIGRLINLSRERVRQLYCIGCTKLKHIRSIDNLRVYIM